MKNKNLNLMYRIVEGPIEIGDTFYEPETGYIGEAVEITKSGLLRCTSDNTFVLDACKRVELQPKEQKQGEEEKVEIVWNNNNNNPDTKTYTQYELENMLQNAIMYGIKEITGHTIGDKIASVLVDEFLDTLNTPNNNNNTSSNYVLSSDNEEDLWWLRAVGMNGTNSTTSPTHNPHFNNNIWESKEGYEEWVSKILARK